MKSNFYLIVFLFVCLSLWSNATISAQAPTNILLSNNTISENEELYTFVGTLSAVDANQTTGHSFILVENEQDNLLFKIQGDSLFSFFSFNFEKQSSYTVLIKTQDATGNVFLKIFPIVIIDLTGKYDQNGIADADIANKYPQVAVGDYIYFNGVGNVSGIYAQNNGAPAISYPNKVLIRGDQYAAISINCAQLNGTTPNQRIPISNFLGQVYVTHYVYFQGGSHWRFTGQYDPTLGIGSPYYTGCQQNNSTVDFGFSHQQYGIWVSRAWIDEGTNLVRVSGTATGFEIDHLEISDGGFSGLMLKYDNNNIHSMDNVEVHHLYIHDIGSEGMYIGSTQSGAQHAFNNLHIHHCAVLRTGGEAIQIGQQSAGCLVEHNVIWGAFDWLSPFNRWQDNVFQLDARNGDITIRNNILMGAAGNAFSVFNRPKTGITPNGLPITLESNLIWCSRGSAAAYQGGPSDGTTPWIWRDNYAGKFFFDYDRVYTTASARAHILSIGIQNNAINATITGNHFDNTRSNFHTLWGGGTVQVTAANNNQVVLNDPQFRYFLNQDDSLNYLKWTRWTARVGEDTNFPANNTNKGQAVNYTVGDVVQYHAEGQTRFYRCLQNHQLQEPSSTSNIFWELLTWNNQGKKSYLPPDDVRMDVGSFYYNKSIGLEGTSGTFLVDAGADQSFWAPATSVQIEGNAYHPTASITSYQWTKISGNTVSFTGQNTRLLSINNPSVGPYTFVLTATASNGNTKTDTTLIKVLDLPQLPVADAGSDLTLGLGTTSVPLNGTASFDPDGQLITYQWTLLDAPLHPVQPTFINFTNNANNAASPWNNTNGTLTAGTAIHNLTNATGALTTIGIELLDNWDGFNANGMVTGNNSGAFPDAVLQASYWFQTGTQRLRVFGLTVNEFYNFEFLGSRNGGGDRTTVYTIGEQEVRLDAAFNSNNTVSLNWVKADNNGEVLIDISKGAGATYGYLNALVIKETNLAIVSPTTAQATLSGVDTGSYWVALKVLDDACFSATDTVLITIGTLTNTTVLPNTASILMSPNPSSGVVHLKIEDKQPSLELIVYNAAGQIIQHQNINQSNNTLDLTNVPAGLYLVTLQDKVDGLIWQSKLVKSN
ncbi:MAG: PKD domain-containing protein [Aureispira sp.]